MQTSKNVDSYTRDFNVAISRSYSSQTKVNYSSIQG